MLRLRPDPSPVQAQAGGLGGGGAGCFVLLIYVEQLSARNCALFVATGSWLRVCCQCSGLGPVPSPGPQAQAHARPRPKPEVQGQFPSEWLMCVCFLLVLIYVEKLSARNCALFVAASSRLKHKSRSTRSGIDPIGIRLQICLFLWICFTQLDFHSKWVAQKFWARNCLPDTATTNTVTTSCCYTSACFCKICRRSTAAGIITKY